MAFVGVRETVEADKSFAAGVLSRNRIGIRCNSSSTTQRASPNASGYLPFLLTSEHEPSGDHADQRSLVPTLHTSVWATCCRPPDPPTSYTVGNLAFPFNLKSID